MAVFAMYAIADHGIRSIASTELSSRGREIPLLGHAAYFTGPARLRHRCMASHEVVEVIQAVEMPVLAR